MKLERMKHNELGHHDIQRWLLVCELIDVTRRCNVLEQHAQHELGQHAQHELGQRAQLERVRHVQLGQHVRHEQLGQHVRHEREQLGRSLRRLR